jgi:hypothetical protein
MKENYGGRAFARGCAIAAAQCEAVVGVNGDVAQKVVRRVEWTPPQAFERIDEAALQPEEGGQHARIRYADAERDH